jgi:hypothetical protein
MDKYDEHKKFVIDFCRNYGDIPYLQILDGIKCSQFKGEVDLLSLIITNKDESEFRKHFDLYTKQYEIICNQIKYYLITNEIVKNVLFDNACLEYNSYSPNESGDINASSEIVFISLLNPSNIIYNNDRVDNASSCAIYKIYIKQHIEDIAYDDTVKVEIYEKICSNNTFDEYIDPNSVRDLNPDSGLEKIMSRKSDNFLFDIRTYNSAINLLSLFKELDTSSYRRCYVMSNIATNNNYLVKYKIYNT